MNKRFALLSKKSLLVQTLVFACVSGFLFCLSSILTNSNEIHDSHIWVKLIIFLLVSSPLYYYYLVSQKSDKNIMDKNIKDIPERQRWFDAVDNPENKVIFYWAIFLGVGGILLQFFGLPEFLYAVLSFIALLILFIIAYKQGRVRLSFILAFFMLILCLVGFATLFLK